MSTQAIQSIRILRPFRDVSPDIQQSVLKAAKKREAYVWKEIEGRLKAQNKMTRADLRATRQAMRSCFERAAMMIFDERAERPDTWETWLYYLHLAQIELGFCEPEISA